MIALLESRMQHEMARLVEKYGGNPRCVPALRQATACRAEVILDVIDDLVSNRHDIAIFMTGVAASVLFEAAEREGLRHMVVSALQRITTVARSPKPAAALRGFGVKPTLVAREPFTSAALVEALSRVPLEDRRALLFHYGERSEEVAAALRGRSAQLVECRLYRWLLPAAPAALGQLVKSIVAREVDALAITCQMQFRHLLEVARRESCERALLDALRRDVALAAVGPSSTAILRRHGLPVHVEPEQHKMDRLVRSLMLYLEQAPRRLAFRPTPSRCAGLEN